MLTRLLFVVFMLTISSLGFGQKAKKDKSFANSMDPVNDENRYVPEASKKKKKPGATYDARDDFDSRMEKNWKRREKREKNISGEQKADRTQPPYFGHKRPPKVRPAEKRKVCKVCGIKH